MKIKILAKIEQNIHKYPGGCWVWTGMLRGKAKDIPDLKFNGSRIDVKELLYGWDKGIFPPKKVYRTCFNCLCVNPLHMSPEEDKRSLIAKLFDDESFDRPAFFNKVTGEINGGFAVAKKTTGTVPHDGQFFEGNGYGRFIQDGKDLKDERLETRKNATAGAMEDFSEEI